MPKKHFKRLFNRLEIKILILKLIFLQSTFSIHNQVKLNINIRKKPPKSFNCIKTLRRSENETFYAQNLEHSKNCIHKK